MSRSQRKHIANLECMRRPNEFVHVSDDELDAELMSFIELIALHYRSPSQSGRTQFNQEWRMEAQNTGDRVLTENALELLRAIADSRQIAEIEREDRDFQDSVLKGAPPRFGS